MGQVQIGFSLVAVAAAGPEAAWNWDGCLPQVKLSLAQGVWQIQGCVFQILSHDGM